MGKFDDLFKEPGLPKKINWGDKEYEINPDAMVYSQHGIDKYEQKDYSGAVNEFTRAINAQPSNQNFYTMRGTAFEDLGNDSAAEKDFRRALELNNNDYVATYRLGMIYFRRKDFVNAIKWLKTSLKNAPKADTKKIGLKNNIAFVSRKVITGNLGNFLVQIKKFEEGLKYLDEAIKLDPKYHRAYLCKGIAYTQIGETEKGLQLLRKASELGNSDADIIIKKLADKGKKAQEESSINKNRTAETTKKELSEHLIARYKKTDGVIFYNDLIKEAIFTVAVNVLLIQKKSVKVSDEFLEVMFNAANKTLLELFPQSYKEKGLNEIKLKYKFLMVDDNVKDIVNHHFNELYSTNIKYV